MSKKVRKQVTLTEEQAAALARRAQELGVSEGALIRQGIQYVCLPAASEPAFDSHDTPRIKPITPADAAKLLEVLEEIDARGQQRLAARGGKRFPPSWPDIERDREERSERWR